MDTFGRLRLAVYLVVCGACAACAHRFASPHTLAGCDVIVEGDRIRCGANAYAEVERYRDNSRHCRALAVRYADGERAWLFVADGFDPERPDAFVDRKTMLQTMDTARGVAITPDGRRVQFWKAGLFGPRTYEYDLASGMLNTIDTPERKAPGSE